MCSPCTRAARRRSPAPSASCSVATTSATWRSTTGSTTRAPSNRRPTCAGGRPRGSRWWHPRRTSRCTTCAVVAEPLPSVSAVLPAYNEAGVIAGVVTRTASALIALDVPEPEIVVVDDGSRDGTAALAGEVACDGVRVRVITHPRNRGYGAAL